MNNLIINNLGSNDIGKSNQRNQIDLEKLMAQVLGVDNNEK